MYHIHQGREETLRERLSLVFPLSTVDPTLSKDLDHILPLIIQISSGLSKSCWFIEACYKRVGVRVQTLHQGQFFTIYIIYYYLIFYFFRNVKHQSILFNPKYFTENKWGKKLDIYINDSYQDKLLHLKP